MRVLQSRLDFTESLIGQINALAEQEGWAVFNDRQIQRDDEANKFAGDEEALAHVRRLAHRRARHPRVP